MFYTLISKLPIISNKSNRKFLKVFILGSVLYLLLHYWLYLDARAEFIEKLKGYIYYVMAVDLCVGWWFSRVSEEDNDDADTEKEYTPEQRADIMKSLQEMRKMQAMRQQALMQPSEQPEDDKKSDHSPFVKKVEGDRSKERDNEKTKESSSHNSKTKKHTTHSEPISKPKEKESDTQFPVFMGNDE